MKKTPTPIKKLSDKLLIKYAKSIRTCMENDICDQSDINYLNGIEDELEKRGYNIHPDMEYVKNE